MRASEAKSSTDRRRICSKQTHLMRSHGYNAKVKATIIFLLFVFEYSISFRVTWLLDLRWLPLNFFTSWGRNLPETAQLDNHQNQLEHQYAKNVHLACEADKKGYSKSASFRALEARQNDLETSGNCVRHSRTSG